MKSDGRGRISTRALTDLLRTVILKERTTKAENHRSLLSIIPYTGEESMSWIRFLAFLEILDSVCKEILTVCQGICCNWQILIASTYQKLISKCIYRYMHVSYSFIMYIEWTIQWPWNKDAWPVCDIKMLDSSSGKHKFKDIEAKQGISTAYPKKHKHKVTEGAFNV